MDHLHSTGLECGWSNMWKSVAWEAWEVYSKTADDSVYVEQYEIIIKTKRKYTSDTADAHCIYYYHNNISFLRGDS